MISEEYRRLNARMHESSGFGIKGHASADRILGLCASLKTSDVLDYGCGKQTLKQALIPHEINVRGYDPAIQNLSARPEPADIVACTDVLEHVEPEYLGDVLADLKRCIKIMGYFLIATGPAMKTMPDGSNPHRIQKRQDWWLPRLWGSGLWVHRMTEINGGKYFDAYVSVKKP